MVVLTTTTVIAYLLLIISGVSKAVMDKINFHYSESVFVTLNGLFWNPVYSWMNKYKEGIAALGPKFFGSTKFFVWMTDAWHLFGLTRDVAFSIAFFLLGAYSTWWLALIGYALSRIVFQIFFKKIFTKN